MIATGLREWAFLLLVEAVEGAVVVAEEEAADSAAVAVSRC